MLAERTRRISERLVGAALVASLIAVTLAVPRAGAADAASGGLTENGAATAAAVDEPSAARTAEAAALIRPDFTVTACPELTDSIYRLYTAYFLRVPEFGGFDFWTAEYASGNWSLPRMSQFFSTSPEFESLYGSLTDAEFIDLVYVNILRRAPDDAGRQYWLNRMVDEGLDRGTVMLFFSESPEYIEQMITSTPLAGHFNWYPEQTSWACGFGATEIALPDANTYVDVMVYNPTRRPIEVTYSQLIDGQWEMALVDAVNPGFIQGFFAIEYFDGYYDGLRMESANDFYWTVVLSPAATPRTRVGWTPL